MATTVGNVLIGAGVLSAYIDPGGGSSAVKTSLGGFRDGLTINFSEDRVNIESQDSLGFIKSIRSRAECTVSTSLLESTFDNLGAALYGDGAATAMPMEATPAFEKALAVEFIASSSAGDLKTWTFSSCVPVMDAELSYSKDSELLIPITFMALAVWDTSYWGFSKIT